MARKPKPPAASVPTLRANFYRAGEATFSGTVVDTGDLARKFTVELVIDGEPVRTQRADAYDHGLAASGTGDGCYGFSFSLPATTVRNGCMVEARLANLGTAIGVAIEIGDEPQSSDPGGPGEFRSLGGGLRFSGWLADGDKATDWADVMVDGELIMRARATGWTQVGSAPPRAVRSFDIHLPERFADGRVHRLTMITAKGETLAGGPLAFVAFAGGLESALAGIAASASARQQGELLDLVQPMGVPFSRY